MRHFVGFEFLNSFLYKKYPQWSVTFVGRYTFYWFRIWRFNFMYRSEHTVTNKI